MLKMDTHLLDTAFSIFDLLQSKGQIMPLYSQILERISNALSGTYVHLALKKSQLLDAEYTRNPYTVSVDSCYFILDNNLTADHIEDLKALNKQTEDDLCSAVIENIIHSGICYDEGQLLIIDHTAMHHERFSRCLFSFLVPNTKCCLIAPLYHKQELLGLLMIAYAEEVPVTDDVERFLLDTAQLLTNNYRTRISLHKNDQAAIQIKQIQQDIPLCWQSLNEEGMILEVNDRWLKNLEYTKEEIIGTWFGDLLTVSGRKTFIQCFKQFKAHGEIHDVVFDIISKSGTPITASFDGIIRHDPQERSRQTFYLYQNITLKKYVGRLQESEQKYHTLFNNSISAMLLIDPTSGIICDANKSACSFYGYSYREITSMRISDINTLSREKITYYMNEAKDYIHNTFEFSHKCKNGTIKRVEVVSNPITIGKDIMLFSIIHDITRRLELEKALRLSQKLDGIEQLTSGVAHNFNNHLAAIMGYTELLQLDTTQDEQKTYLKHILTSCRRSKDMISQLLSFTKNTHTQRKSINIHALLNESIHLLEDIFDQRITIITHFHAKQQNSTVDENQMQTVILNLAFNSRDAMPYGGTLTFSTENVILSEERLAELSLPPDTCEFLKLTIEDNGTGIDDETISHIYEPFFTTKPKGKGTGLGLSTVWKIVKGHQGTIQVSSTQHVGTSFTLHIPLARDMRPSGTKRESSTSVSS